MPFVPGTSDAWCSLLFDLFTSSRTMAVWETRTSKCGMPCARRAHGIAHAAAMEALMMASDVVKATTISNVWVGLGGDKPTKFGRARAFFRDGNNQQAVSLNDERGVFFDHRDHVGGGVLDLVQHIRKCKRSEAAKWVADLVGAELDDKPMSLADRREYARRRAAAEREAVDLLRWKGDHRLSLRGEYHRLWKLHHAATRFILSNGLDSPLGDLAADLCEIAEAMIERLRADIDLFDAAPFADLLPIFRDERSAAA
jgi:hypothetical protein